MSFEEGDFDIQIEDSRLTFTSRKEFVVEEQAREVVWHYINDWEVSAGLEHGRDAFLLHFDKGVVMEKRSPVGGGV